jgi:hypothetical protein
VDGDCNQLEGNRNMITPLRIASVLAVSALFGSWAGIDAKAQTSLCFERCTGQYGWPADQCRSFCRRGGAKGRVSSYKGSGYRSSVEKSARAGGCGTYKYWKGNACADARNK